MIDTRIQSVTDLLRKMRDLSSQLYEILSPEIVSYEIIRGDLEKKRAEMKTLDEAKAVANIEIMHAKELAAKIKETANEEAGRIIESGRSVLVAKVSEMNKLLDQTKEFAMTIDKKRYMKLREEAEKNNGNLAGN